MTHASSYYEMLDSHSSLNLDVAEIALNGVKVYVCRYIQSLLKVAMHRAIMYQ